MPEVILGDPRIPQVGPVFFKFLDFVFRHISLNLRLRFPWTTRGKHDRKYQDQSDFEGFVIDTSAGDRNKGFAVNSIDMSQSILCLSTVAKTEVNGVVEAKNNVAPPSMRS